MKINRFRIAKEEPLSDKLLSMLGERKSAKEYYDIEPDKLEWRLVETKEVEDSDGFMTDYAWYTDDVTKHIFMFGDRDLYTPDPDYADWTIEIDERNPDASFQRAQEWFDNYKGFSGEDYLSDYEDSVTEGVAEDLLRILGESESAKENLSDNMTVEDIAKKHNVSIDKIKEQVNKGIKVEKEHTDDEKKAERIALDHLFEMPDYYDRLAKMEKGATEDTVKQGSHWVNKGKEGTHGKFKTKKAADAQRKAMFASGYKANEAAAAEADVVLSPTMLNDPNDINIKDLAKKAFDDEEEQKKQAELEARKIKFQQSLGGLKAAVDNATAIDDKLQILFEEYVPDEGKADTKAGEAVRAMMRILYRDWNDGDIFYDGYGLETAGSSAEYLMGTYEDLTDDLEKIVYDGLEDQAYTDAITKVAGKLIDVLFENPEYFYEANEDDSRDWNTDWLEENRPTYDFEGWLPDEIVEHLSDQDIIWNIQEWEVNGGRISRIASEVRRGYGASVYIEGLPKEAYDDLDKNWDSWTEDWANEVIEEYGEDEEYDEEGAEEAAASESESKTINVINPQVKVCNHGQIGKIKNIPEKEEYDNIEVGRPSFVGESIKGQAQSILNKSVYENFIGNKGVNNENTKKSKRK